MSKIVQSLSILFFTIYAVVSSWQGCNGKCYHLGDSKLSFDYIDSYCNALTGNSKPVDFGSKLQQTLTTQLSMCRLQKSDGEPYWINRYITIYNQSNHDCRTVQFSGATVGIKTTPCSYPSRPFCETDNNSLCQTSNKIDTISKGFPCPSQQRNAGLMRYSSPLVYTIDTRNASETHQVMCKKHIKTNTGNSTLQSSSQSATMPQTAMASSITRAQTTLQTPLKSLYQTTMTTTPTAKAPPSTLKAKSNPQASWSAPLHSTTKPVARMKQSTKPIITHRETVPPTPQSKAVPPKNHCLPAGRQNGFTIAVSNTSEPQWLKVGSQDYFVNYNSSAYKQMGNVSFNYFKMLASPTSTQTGEFWIGAHTSQNRETVQSGLTYSACKTGTVRFRLTNEQVQSMWQELRRQRNNNVKKP